jgi:uncharacterized protein YoxC
MSIIKDISDTVEIVAKSVKNIQEISKAVKTGVGYLKIKHPEVKDDLKAMCIELQKTCDAISKSSSVITHFKFNGSPQAIQSEPTRFNEHYKEYKLNSTYAQNVILELKGSCFKIKQHIGKYEEPSTGKSIFTFLGMHDQEKEDKLFEAVQRIYNDELDFINIVHHLGKAITESINHISKSMEHNNMMDYTLVPVAASLLNAYATQFLNLELSALEAKEELANLIDDLK